MNTLTEQQQVNLGNLIPLVMADIDIFLLQNEAQTGDLDKNYTKDEIRLQLHKTCERMLTILSEAGYDIYSPLKRHKFGGLKQI